MHRRRPFLLRLLHVLAASSVASCFVGVSFDRYDVGDSSGVRFAVGGDLEGLEGEPKASLSLNSAAAIPVGDGPFEFADRVLDGEKWSVKADHPTHDCIVTPNEGTIHGGAVHVDVRCTSKDVRLDDLVVADNGVAVPVSPQFVAGGAGPFSAVVGLPLSSHVAVRVKTHSPSAKLTIGGAPASSNQDSPVVTRPGKNVIGIHVDAANGAKADYSLALDASRSTYVKSARPQTVEELGTSVALSGDTLAVGVPREGSGATGVNGGASSSPARGSGAVYVFRRVNGKWAQEAYIKASNTDADDGFGTAVALSGDTLAVGAPYEQSSATGINGGQGNDFSSGSAAGAVYVFRRTSGAWAQEAYVKPSNTRLNFLFGAAVALSGDTLAVGAPHEDSGSVGVNQSQGASASGASSGAAYVFRRANGAWSQEAFIKASNVHVGDSFGASVALSDDTLAVGARFESSSAKGVNDLTHQNDTSASQSGAAYVFRRVSAVWSQEAYVKAPTTQPGAEFGSSVALSNDTLAVGASNVALSPAAFSSGAAYVFRRANAVWAQEAYLAASNARASSSFGDSVALVGDALLVGAPGESSAATGVDGDQANTGAPAAGAAYLFRRAGSAWTQDAYVKASVTHTADQFGTAVALSTDAMAIGAPGESGASPGVDGDQAKQDALRAGAAYVY